MDHRKLSSVLLTSLLAVSVLAVGTAGIATAGNDPLETAANQPLEDGGIYFQGQILYNDTVASPSEQLELRNSSGNLTRNVTVDDSGMFVVDSTDLEGEYALHDEYGSLVEFEIVEQNFDFGYQNYYYVDNGTATRVTDLEMDTNRYGDYPIELESSTLNLTERVEGVNEEDGTTFVTGDQLPAKVNVSDLENGTYRIEANVTDTTARGNITFRPSNVTHVEFDRHTKTVEITEGGSYWGSHSLRYDHGIDERLDVYVEEPDGDLYVDEIEMNEHGWHVFSGWYTNDTYYAKNDSSRVVNFSTTTHRVEASFDTSTVENGNGETNLSVESNRNGYDLVLWAENLSRATLNEATPNSTVTDEGDLVVQNLDANESLTLNYSSLPVGNYTIHAASHDTTTQGTANLTVEDPSPPDDEDDGDDENGGGGGGGDVPPPSTRVEVVEESKQHVRAKITSARADSSASVTLSGLGTDAATFQHLDVTPVSSDPLPRFFLDVLVMNTSEVDPSDETETLAALRVEPTYVTNDELEAVTVRFRTSTNAADPESVTLYRRAGGEWTTLDTEFVGERDGEHVFRAVATGASVFAVGADESVSNETTDSETGTSRTRSTTERAGETTAAETRSAMASGTTRSATTESSGAVGHDLSSVFVPIVALILAFGLRERSQ